MARKCKFRRNKIILDDHSIGEIDSLGYISFNDDYMFNIEDLLMVCALIAKNQKQK